MPEPSESYTDSCLSEGRWFNEDRWLTEGPGPGPHPRLFDSPKDIDVPTTSGPPSEDKAPDAKPEPAVSKVPRPSTIVGVLLKTALKSALEAHTNGGDYDGVERVASLQVCREALEVYYRVRDLVGAPVQDAE